MHYSPTCQFSTMSLKFFLTSETFIFCLTHTTLQIIPSLYGGIFLFIQTFCQTFIDIFAIQPTFVHTETVVITFSW